MFGFIATLRIDPSKADVFEQAFEDVARSVREKEPDTLVYHLGKSRDEAGVYRVVEVYTDKDALKAHLATEHFQAFKPKMIDALIAPPESETLDVII